MCNAVPNEIKDNFIDLPLTTPARIVWEKNLSPDEIEDLRKQVDLALLWPDFSIVLDHPINWEELTATQE